MPVSPTYPGVYIEELPSAVRTIIGVPTAVTAFVGSAPRGPANKSVDVTSFAEFEREFGDVSPSHPMTYAVQHFYLNGGQRAVIVRVAGEGSAAAAAQLGAVRITASGAGAWGNALRVRVTAPRRQPDAPAAPRYNLAVRDNLSGREEQFVGISTDRNSKDSLPKQLKRGSKLLTAADDQTDMPDLHGPAPGARVDPLAPDADTGLSTPLADGDDGGALTVPIVRGGEDPPTGIYALRAADIFNMLVIPPLAPDEPGGEARDVHELLPEAVGLCAERRAVMIVDPPNRPMDVAAARAWFEGLPDAAVGDRNVAVYFPRVVMGDSAQDGLTRPFPPAGAIAGIYARTDAERGVWKAPAGTEATLNGAIELELRMDDLQNGQLNPAGLNCLRTFPVIGNVVWGARTKRGADELADQWKYLPVRRLALFIEETLFRTTKWVVFEPNDEPLWAQIRMNIGAFMQGLFRQGAFQGSSPQQAYFVKCDHDTNPQIDIDKGIVNIIVGFAPLKPAEFVIIKIKQISPLEQQQSA